MPVSFLISVTRPRIQRSKSLPKAKKARPAYEKALRPFHRLRAFSELERLREVASYTAWEAVENFVILMLSGVLTCIWLASIHSFPMWNFVLAPSLNNNQIYSPILWRPVGKERLNLSFMVVLGMPDWIRTSGLQSQGYRTVKAGALISQGFRWFRTNTEGK